MKGEAKMLETEALIFPVKYEETKSVTDSQTQPAAGEKKIQRLDFNLRFARLKRSIKKRPASIL